MRRRIARRNKAIEDRVPFTMLLPEDVSNQLREYALQTGQTLTDVILRGIDLATAGEPVTAANVVAFETTDEQSRILKQLSADLFLDDVNATVKMVALKAATAEREALMHLLSGGKKEKPAPAKKTRVTKFEQELEEEVQKELEKAMATGSASAGQQKAVKLKAA